MTDLLRPDEGLQKFIDSAFAPSLEHLKEETAFHLVELVARLHVRMVLIGQIPGAPDLHRRPGLMSRELDRANAEINSARSQLWEEVRRAESHSGVCAFPFADTWKDYVTTEWQYLKSAHLQAKIARSRALK